MYMSGSFPIYVKVTIFVSYSFFSFFSSFCFILSTLFRKLTSFGLIILTVFLFTFVFYQRYMYLFYYNNTLLQPVLCSIGWHELLGIIYSVFGLLNIDISVCPFASFMWYLNSFLSFSSAIVNFYLRLI